MSKVVTVRRVHIPLDGQTTLDDIQGFIRSALAVFGDENVSVGAEARGTEVQLYAVGDVA
jgi:hypothetical protein